MARVLVAEANERIRDFIAGVLKEFGHAVAACSNRNEAGRLVADAAFDVVVTDLALQSREGERFGLDCANLGIPMITLSGREYHPGATRREPLQTLYEKPFRFADLQSVLDAVADRSDRTSRPQPAAA
jgi:DNA-binding NtrC family response regulator